MFISDVLYFQVFIRIKKLVEKSIFILFYGFIQIESRLLKKNEKRKPKIILGTSPILNYKYWKGALNHAGFEATTLMIGYFNIINKKEDFDIYADDIKLGVFNNILNQIVKYLFKSKVVRDIYILRYACLNYDIFDCSCDGFIIGEYSFWEKEAIIMKKYNSRIVVNPYGGDMYMYSQIKDPSVLHGFMMNFPQNASKEDLIKKKVRYWSHHADCFKPNLAIDGINKWSILPYNTLCIDIKEWKRKENYSMNDGVNGEVVIVHSPNHRGVKGTEFIIKSIEDLKSQGIKIKLILLEKKQNNEVKRVLYEEADILVEQLIFTAYALSGIEGMATGLPVLANLESEVYTRVFRRYSYLNESPVLSTTPESIKENLKFLIQNPILRKELGIAGRKYVEKYHSYESGAYMFEKIYDKIWYGKDVDLLNLYHPLNPNSYNNLTDKIKHPLFENKLPSDLTEKTLL